MGTQTEKSGNSIVVVAVVAIVCVTLIIVVALLRSPRYQKAGPNNNLILDTRTGKMLRMDGTPYQYPKYK